MHHVGLYVSEDTLEMSFDKILLRKPLQQLRKSELDLKNFSFFIGGFPQELIHKFSSGEYAYGFGGCIGNLSIRHLDYTESHRDTFFQYFFNEDNVPSENFLMYFCSKICALNKPPFPKGLDEVPELPEE